MERLMVFMVILNSLISRGTNFLSLIFPISSVEPLLCCGGLSDYQARKADSPASPEEEKQQN